MSKLSIKNIIFDLGGIIIDIDYKRTEMAFQKYGIYNFGDYYSQKKQTSIFTDFEIGIISESVFRANLRDLLNCNIADDDIDRAWNVMLLDFSTVNLNFITELKKRYNIYLFSNTNIIHMCEINRKYCMLNSGIDSLGQLFNQCYYSHIFGRRKPNPESFLEIIHENNINASETLFIDDTDHHVQGARHAGLHGLHLTDLLDLINLENKYIPQLLRDYNDEN